MRKVLSFAVLVLLSPLLLVIGLFILLSLPFELALYKRSPWYKDKGEKFTFGVRSAGYYKIYNLAAKCGFPLSHREIEGYHFFFFEDRVLFPLCDHVDDLFYSEEDGGFMVLEFGENEEAKTAISLESFMEKVYSDACLDSGCDLWIALFEGALGDHVKEGRERFAVFADKGELKMLLSFFCGMEEGESARLEEKCKTKK